jgi:hypothetical protein
MYIVKVKYYSETTKELSPREYTYYSADTLKIGDIVTVPVRDTTAKAKVSAIDVPESEIAAFKEKVKTISAGAVIKEEQTDTETVEISYTITPEEVAVAMENIPSANMSQNVPETAAIIQIKPETNPTIIRLKTELGRIRDLALSRTITKDEDLTPATNDLAIIAKFKKTLEDTKSEYLKPLKAHMDDFNAVFNGIKALLEEADTVTRLKIKQYRDEAIKRAAEAEEINRQKNELARKEAAFSGTGEFTTDTTPVDVPAPVNRVSTEMGTVSATKIWKWELQDMEQVPDDYKIIDAGKITKVVKAGLRNIPGIRIYCEDSLRVNTK